MKQVLLDAAWVLAAFLLTVKQAFDGDYLLWAVGVYVCWRCGVQLGKSTFRYWEARSDS